MEITRKQDGINKAINKHMENLNGNNKEARAITEAMKSSNNK